MTTPDAIMDYAQRQQLQQANEQLRLENEAMRAQIQNSRPRDVSACLKRTGPVGEYGPAIEIHRRTA